MARKKSFFGIARSFVRTVEKEYKKSVAAQKRAESQDAVKSGYSAVDIAFTNENGQRYVSAMPIVEASSKYGVSAKKHLQALVSFYKDYAEKYRLKDGENPAAKFIQNLFPNADAHTCPHCGIVHEFKASRARRCPECSKQLIVRQGKFFTEQQVAKFEAFMSDFYEKSGAVHQLKNNIERAQSDIGQNDLGRAFLAIAEGYQLCAVIFNKKYDNGYSAWDLSWGVLNREALEVATYGASDEFSLVSSGYTDVMFARGMQCLRQLKHTASIAGRQKFGILAVTHFYDYLIVLNAYDLTDWHEEDAMKNIHIATALGKLDNGALSDIESRASERSPIKQVRVDVKSIFDKVSSYVFLENDNERLEQYIY